MANAAAGRDEQRLGRLCRKLGPPCLDCHFALQGDESASVVASRHHRGPAIVSSCLRNFGSTESECCTTTCTYVESSHTTPGSLPAKIASCHVSFLENFNV